MNDEVYGMASSRSHRAHAMVFRDSEKSMISGLRHKRLTRIVPSVPVPAPLEAQDVSTIPYFLRGDHLQ